MLTQKIRRSFFEYFKREGHTIVSSSSLVPHDDPTLLFTNAGMNPFKDIFLGKTPSPYSCAASSQKCVRVGGKHNDLENVGHTARHLTFFEMLGNFSFGDYFKADAIRLAYHLVDEVLEFDLDRIWISVHNDDDEAFEIWKQYLPKNRIIRLGDKDNFWSMGPCGPCGPCSELFFDRGKQYGQATSPGDDEQGDRFLEFWNLVFMQHDRKESGKLETLPKKCIDTGAGLERLVALKMGVDNIFETDIFTHLIDEIKTQAGITSKENLIAANVIADHLRLLSFTICDGVTPGNSDRGYILRKVLRRAVRYGKEIGFNAPFLAKLVPSLITTMGEDYPELSAHKDSIQELLTFEEESFHKTLRKGGKLLSQVCESAKNENRSISGEEAFKLKDTYGMPYDEIQLLAKDHHLLIDEKAYKELEQQAKELSRSQQKNNAPQANSKIFTDLHEQGIRSEFIGYDSLSVQSKILSLIADSQSVSSIGKSHSYFEIVTEKTPFYAEKGGQVADQGFITTPHFKAQVINCQNPQKDLFVHTCKRLEGTLSIDDLIDLKVDVRARLDTSAHHTATHLLQWALCKVLDANLQQKGSLVSSNGLRFDFNHPSRVSDEELRRAEELVNQQILENSPVYTYESPYEEVNKDPSIKQFFGDKYGDSVRVVKLTCGSELCGGTHVKSLGQIGSFYITKESSISAGTRRIEAVTSHAALAYVQSQRKKLSSIEKLLKTSDEHLEQKIHDLIEQGQSLKKELQSIAQEQVKQLAKDSFQSVESENGLDLIVVSCKIENALLITLMNEFNSFTGVAFIVNESNAKTQIAIKLGQQALDRKFHAGKMISSLAPLIDGKGGGKPQMAQAGGPKLGAIKELTSFLKQMIHSHES